MAPLLNSSNSIKNPAKHPNSETLWSCRLHGAVVQIEVEFWSTSFAAPKPLNMNHLVELVGNYPPLPLITQKNGSILFLPSPCAVTPSLPCHRLPPPPPWVAIELLCDRALPLASPYKSTPELRAAISLPSSAAVRLPSGDRGCPPVSLRRAQHGSGSSELTGWRTGPMPGDVDPARTRRGRGGSPFPMAGGAGAVRTQRLSPSRWPAARERDADAHGSLPDGRRHTMQSLIVGPT